MSKYNTSLLEIIFKCSAYIVNPMGKEQVLNLINYMYPVLDQSFYNKLLNALNLQYLQQAMDKLYSVC